MYATAAALESQLLLSMPLQLHSCCYTVSLLLLRCHYRGCSRHFPCPAAEVWVATEKLLKSCVSGMESRCL